MQSLEHIYETRLTDDALYEVTEVQCQDSMEHEAVWLNEKSGSECERGVRLLAEFDNYRRRTRQEHALAEQNGKRAVLLALLDVMDDFDRALLHLGEAPDPVVNGVRLIH
jgi:molecular chaperone GrpE